MRTILGAIATIAAGALAMTQLSGCVALGCSGPEDLPCSGVAYYPGLTVDLAMVGMLPRGHYDIEVQAAGQSITIGIDMLERSSVCAAAADCRVEVELAEDTLVVEAELFFNHGMINVFLLGGGGPDDVTVALRHGDATIVSEHYAPDYQTSEDSADGCGLDNAARVTLPVVAPDA